MNRAQFLGFIISIALHSIVFVSVSSMWSPGVKVSASALSINIQERNQQPSSLRKTTKPLESLTQTGSPGVKKIKQASLIGNLAPTYPWLARMKGEEGLVVIALQVDRQGKPYNINLQKSSGHESLDIAAIEAVKNARYEAGDESPLELSLNFKLNDKI